MLQCSLCPKACLLKLGQSGECRIRVNRDGKLTAVTYGFPCSVHVDPIEKKPLFHFYPASRAFSVATVGCNLHCKNCQNWEISQANPEDSRAYYLPPEKLVQLAKQHNCKSVAYTYTEPLVYYEYTLDSSIKMHEAGLKNVLVTAGYINPLPMKKLCKYTDAANIDLKAFSDDFYRNICNATLKPVLDTLVLTKSEGVIVEITNLLITSLNDSDKMIRDLCRWIVENMGSDTPLHFSRFHPNYKMRNLPPTPESTLKKARDIAIAEGLKHVYIGNLRVKHSSDTLCPNCKKTLVARQRYLIKDNKIKEGKCPYCNTKIYGEWQ